jgi:amino acid adenylation domain-containing protein
LDEKLAGLSPAKRALLERRLKARADERAQDPRNQPIPKRAAGAATPLSFNQGILWIMDQLQPGETAYNVPRASRVKGDLRLDVLQKTVDALVVRHEVIRTTYREVAGTPSQVVNPPSSVPVRFTDLTALAPDVREVEGDHLLVAASRYAFDLANDLMLRVDVIKMGPQDHILLLLTHHICSDGWSKAVLFREFSDLYDAFARGEPNPLPPLAIQYADFANWQRTGAAGDLLNKQVAYWKNRLAGAPSLLELPLDHPRPPVRTFAGSHQTLQLPRPLADALRALAQREGATPFMVGMAVFQVLMHRYTQQDDISVGTPIAGRYRKELQGMLGFFTNTLVIRTDFSGNPTFRQLLGRVREAALGAYDHQELPFEKLVLELNPERSLSHTPLFQVMFVLQNLPPAERTPAGLTMTQVKSERGNSKFDLMLSMIEHADGMTGSIEYATDLFDPATITRMCGHFRTLVEAIVANPDREVALLPMLSPAERDQLLHAFNETKTDFPTDRCLPQLIEEQAARSPEAIAVVGADGTDLTYRALNARANQLAHHLRALGVGPEVKVGIAIRRSLDMVVGLLGILKAGGACVPLDPTYPEDRLRLMIEEAALPFLLTQAAFADVLPKSAAKLIQIDADGPSISARSPENPSPAARPADLGYLLFTSGSTGRPKGVLLSHKGLANFCCAAIVRYGVTAADRVLQFATVNFDAHIEEIYPSLMAGATLHLRDDEMISSTGHFSRWTKQRRITLLDLPTAYWHEWVRELSTTGETLDPGLRGIIVGGEQAQTAAYAAWMKVPGARNVRWFNTAAPTECTVVTAVYEGDRNQAEVPVELPIGRPIGNTTCYVLDERHNPVPIGVCGEWVIGGAGVARGYLDRPELTAEKFIADPWSDTPGARMYRTGDRARYLPDGNIVLMGRVDQQVKLRGFRIELGEIETVLGGHPAVGQNAVIAREDTPGNKRLVAYVVARQGQSVSVPDLKAFIRAKLPEYMVPAAIVLIDSLPLNANGKLDRKALPAPDRSGFDASDQFVAPRTPVEEKIAAIWIKVLAVPRVGVHDNFFDLGGHSLLAAQMMSLLEGAFGRKIPLAALFENQTVEGLSRFYGDDSVVPEKWPTVIPIQAKGTRTPLFCVSRFNVSALGYIALTRNLSPDQPVFGLQSQYRVEDIVPYQRSELMTAAKQYLAAMREVQPHGPYNLIGMCEGALISFEMARLLLEAGEKVGLLGMVDAFPIENTRRYYLTKIESYRRLMAKRLKRIRNTPANERAPELRNLVTQFTQYQSKVVRRTLEKVGIKLPFLNHAPSAASTQKTDELVSFAEAYKNYYWPGPDFVPPTVDTEISLFRIRDQPLWRISDPACGWGTRTTVGVDIHTLNCDHFSVLREPYVGELAKMVAACLAKGTANGKPS